MEDFLKTVLEQLGLEKKERQFFIYTYTNGPISINDIARGARLERSTAYLLANDLIDRGFIHEDFKNYKKKLIATEARTLLRMLQAKERSLGRKSLELEEKLPQLQAVYQASENRPKVQVFEGKEGLLRVKEDILSQNQEILLWTNQETEHQVFSELEHNDFIDKRISNKIKIRVLVVDNLKGKALQSKDGNFLRETKVLPKSVVFTSETYIYGKKVAILDYKKDIFGIIVESTQIADFQRAIFEMAWKKD